jgi:hypothetical protein
VLAAAGVVPIPTARQIEGDALEPGAGGGFIPETDRARWVRMKASWAISSALAGWWRAEEAGAGLSVGSEEWRQATMPDSNAGFANRTWGVVLTGGGVPGSGKPLEQDGQGDGAERADNWRTNFALFRGEPAGIRLNCNFPALFSLPVLR